MEDATPSPGDEATLLAIWSNAAAALFELCHRAEELELLCCVLAEMIPGGFEQQLDGQALELLQHARDGVKQRVLAAAARGSQPSSH